MSHAVLALPVATPVSELVLQWHRLGCCLQKVQIEGLQLSGRALSQEFVETYSAALTPR